MAWDIRQQLRVLTESAGRGLNRVRQRSFVEALAAAYSLMLQSGTGVDQVEARRKLQVFMDNTEALAGYSAADLDKLLAQHRQEADFEALSAAREWLTRVARLRGQDDAARLLVRVSMAVVGGAGALDTGQRRAVGELCDALGLALDDFLPDSPTPPASTGTASGTAPASPSDPPATPAKLLQPGERVELAALGAPANGPLGLSLNWSARPVGGVNPAVFLLDGHGRVSGDTDVVFYNQPRDAHGAVVLSGGATVGFELHLALLPERVQRLAVTLSVDREDFRTLGEVVLDLAADNATLLRFVLPGARHGETAMVLGELYRRGAAWRFAALGQGYRGGLAAMCQQFGVSLAD